MSQHQKPHLAMVVLVPHSAIEALIMTAVSVKSHDG